MSAAGAHLAEWPALEAALAGPIRVLVLARTAAVAAPALAALAAAGLAATVCETHGEHSHLANSALRAHALLWVAEAAAPLPAHERDLLDAAGARLPARRALWFGDAGLLHQLTDDAEAALTSAFTRGRTLLGDSWERLPPDALASWAEALAADATRLRAERHDAVADALLAEATARARETARHEAEARAAGAAEAAIDARADAQRRALAGVAVEAATRALLAEYDALHLALRERLPGQIRAVGDPLAAREALPAWLAAVTSAWVAPREAVWREAVLAEAVGLGLDPRALRLVSVSDDLPRLDPPDAWRRRLTTTALLGGGLGLLAFGLWLPGLLGVAGGLGWQRLPWGDQEEPLIVAAIAQLDTLHAARRAEAAAALDALAALLTTPAPEPAE